MSIVKKFLDLNPVLGVEYQESCLTAYGWLRENESDTHGATLRVDGLGRVWRTEGVVIDNVYRGERAAPQQIR